MAYWRRHPAPHPVSGMFWKWQEVENKLDYSLQFVPWKTQRQLIQRILKWIHHSLTYLTLICLTSIGSGRRGSFVTWVSVEGSNLNLSCKPDARSQSSQRICLFLFKFITVTNMQSSRKYKEYFATSVASLVCCQPPGDIWQPDLWMTEAGAAVNNLSLFDTGFSGVSCLLHVEAGYFGLSCL